MIEALEYLLLKALNREAKSGIVRERNFILRCNPKNYEKLMNIYCPGQFGWGIHEFNLTFNGIQIRICSDYNDLNLCMEIGNQISKDEYIFLAKIENWDYIIHIKKFRLYRMWGKIPTLHNFNHNNDIIPWIQYQFRKLKDKVFGVKFIEEDLNLIQKFVDPVNRFDYDIYNERNWTILQIKKGNTYIREKKYFPQLKRMNCHNLGINDDCTMGESVFRELMEDFEGTINKYNVQHLREKLREIYLKNYR